MNDMAWHSRPRRRRALAMPILALVGLLGVVAAGVAPAHAAKIYFGTQEHLRPIQDVAIKGPQGEALYLGFKYSFRSFIAPYSLTDDGYILGVKGRDSYLPLDAAKIRQFQSAGLLPSPLPPYRLAWPDYVIGYLLWEIGAVLLVMVIVARRRQRRRQRAETYFNAAVDQSQEGEVDLAIASYTKAFETDPKFALALVNRGVLRAQRGEFDPAIADFTKAMKLGPKDISALAYLNRGNAYRSKADFRHAITDLSQAVMLSKSAEAYFSRANAFATVGDQARAIVDYTRVLELAPNAAIVYQARGRAYAAQGDDAAAQDDYDRAAALAAESAAAADMTPAPVA